MPIHSAPADACVLGSDGSAECMRGPTDLETRAAGRARLPPYGKSGVATVQARLSEFHRATPQARAAIMRVAALAKKFQKPRRTRRCA
jgi:hypothetical protein